jgi:hypothetical protein
MSTTLTREQVAAQIREWTTAGLPEGRLSFADGGARAQLCVGSQPAVRAWAQALNTHAVTSGETFGTWPVRRPVALGGVELDVWCDLPHQPAPVAAHSIQIDIIPD